MCRLSLRSGHNERVDKQQAPRDVVIVVFDGVKLLDVSGPAEVFAEANRFGATYRLRFASLDGEDVMTSVGARFAVGEALLAVESVETLLVAGGDGLVGQPIDPQLVAAVRAVAPRARRLASICTGAFILAQAGLLDGHRATTHWRHTRLLAKAFPQIRVEPDAIFVNDGDVFTSAGVSAGIDLALAMVEMDFGGALVRDVARSLVVYLKRAGGQSQFSVLVEANPAPQSALRAVTDAIVADPGADHSVKSLAAHAALSTRQLTRLFHSELGTTPARYVELVRIDIARGALDAGRSVGDSARLAGFGSAETFRRVFVTNLGVSPKAYRDRFRTATPA
jgi:transcriptional regulator GlxA family with amidase domain